ncbi:MAG: hypothetical protein QOG85_2683 [Gaiellaceae bacterium]|nr:hypothetical protein [Gaiellaceae bacterium]
MKKFLEIGGVVAGVVLIAFGVAAIVLGVNGKNTVGSELKSQQIVGSPDMSPAGIAAEVKGQPWAKTYVLPTCTVAGMAVTNGDRARCFAQYMQVHTLEATQGVRYADMGRYVALPDAPASALNADGATSDPKYAQIDPVTKQPVTSHARDIWVTETALTTALNTSYMAEQMANFGIVVGIALLLSGVGFMILALGGALEAQSVFAAWRKKSPIEPKAAVIGA